MPPLEFLDRPSQAVKPVTDQNPLPVVLEAGPSINIGEVQIGDGINTATKATVFAAHAGDNTALGSGNALNTGGIAQILNPAGGLDRQRETAFDNIPAAGVASGTQQLQGPVLSTTVSSGAITGNVAAQNVTLTAVSFVNRGVTTTIQVGTTLLVDPGAAAQEYVFVTAVNGAVVTGVFRNNHAANVVINAVALSVARDATIPDGSAPAGIQASAAYLFNAPTNGVEFERSAAGELDGASGIGTNIAAEYEWNGGGPANAAGTATGFQFDRARSLQAKGLSSGAITATTVGNTSITFTGGSAATKLLAPGQAIRLRGGAVMETVYASPTWVPGSAAAVPLQSPVVNATQTTAEWDAYAVNGPGTSGFLPHGVGIEEEALWDPVSNLFYIERAATQDAMAATNIVAESPALWNGATMDRARSATGATGSADVRSGGRSSSLNVTADTVIKASAGRAVRVTVQTAIATAAVTLNDTTTTGGAAAANAFHTIPIGAAIGTIYYLDWPCANGIVAKFGAATGAIAVSFD